MTKRLPKKLSVFVKKHSTVLKFALSSFTCYAVEYALYSVFVTVPVLWGGRVHVKLSNVGSRIIGSAMNFSINRKFVFGGDGGRMSKLIEYFSLVAAVLAGGTFILGLLVEKCHFNRYFTKIAVDTAFFVVNWLVQRFVIFRED